MKKFTKILLTAVILCTAVFSTGCATLWQSLYGKTMTIKVESSTIADDTNVTLSIQKFRNHSGGALSSYGNPINIPLKTGAEEILLYNYGITAGTYCKLFITNIDGENKEILVTKAGILESNPNYANYVDDETLLISGNADYTINLTASKATLTGKK